MVRSVQTFSDNRLMTSRFASDAVWFKKKFASILTLLFVVGAVSQSSVASPAPLQNQPAAKPDVPQSDILHLKAGGILKGKIKSEKKDTDDGRVYILFETESGGLLKLDRQRLIRKVDQVDSIDLEYQRLAKLAGDDPNLHWKIYRWCDDQKNGSARFKSEKSFHLRRIMELDANDEKARRLLGYDLVDGRWILKSKSMQDTGTYPVARVGHPSAKRKLMSGENWLKRNKEKESKLSNAGHET